VVKSPNYLSDHSQVIIWINLYKNTNTDNITTSQPPISKLPLQYIWNNESSRNFKKAPKSEELQEKLSTFLDKDFSSDRESINKCVNEFQSIIDLASKKSLKIKKMKFR
jgi:ABC-type ATPase with predicted acetyltransferase domain